MGVAARVNVVSTGNEQHLRKSITETAYVHTQRFDSCFSAIDTWVSQLRNGETGSKF